ncbi:hypothetical protein HZA71_01340 [Candidatus Falkowbacteria bacterium]|nr:hypothetical protein [Candidatus Falkowbacteria bacterium]
MALTEIQQTFELIKKSKSILIIFKKDWTGDALASSLALANILKKSDKQVDIVCQDFKPSAALSFLPLPLILTGLQNLQKFIISIKTAKTQIDEFFYARDKEKLNIYLTPREGQFNNADITTSTSDYKYDLIFVVNSSDLESLGGAYDQHTDFFYKTAKINIDNSGRNEYFGNVNLVNLTAASTAEIIYDLIKNIEEKLIDEDAATYLLAGIILATKNFKTSNVTPQTLSIASLLVAKGGRREQIIQNLYQNRFLSTLKLWGRVLSRLNYDLDGRLVWSVISASDFLETSTSPAELIDVIDELIVSMPKTEMVALIYEIKNVNGAKIKCLLYSAKNNLDSLFMAKKFNPAGNKELANFTLPNIDIAEAEKIIIEEIKNKLK